jgi:hypothetical protein
MRARAIGIATTGLSREGVAPGLESKSAAVVLAVWGGASINSL